MTRLIEEVFLPAFDNPWLNPLNDQASVDFPGGRLVMATDSHVVRPLFFPGGDIGTLSVHGTVNDVAMAGARPLYLSAGFILEEGFPLKDLERIVRSMAEAASRIPVPIVTGDTKVVEKGKGDGLFINTTGIGIRYRTPDLSADRVRPGDSILLSGTIGDHGTAILATRENLSISSKLASDTAPLHDLAARMLDAVPEIRCMRDPTRGGLATLLNEIARQSGTGAHVREEAIPVQVEVRAVCEILGLDPLYVANEGKLVAYCPPERADALLEAMRSHPQGREAAIIGEATEDPRSFVQMTTLLGGRRNVDWLIGDPLPRIC